MPDRYDLIVIGGGSAGLTAVRFARRLGLSVALVERDRIGGDCTWTGCVPSKALLKAAGLAYEMRSASRFGLLPPHNSPVDFSMVMSRVRGVMQAIHDAESPDALREDGIEVVHGEARFIDSHSIRVEESHLAARRFLVCTGASPVIPPIPGLLEVLYLTYETVWGLTHLPSRLAVVGGGPIGCELAQAFLRLGSSVTLVEAGNRLLLLDEPEASALVATRLKAEGLELKLGTTLASVQPYGQDISLSLSNGEAIGADTLLIVVGRRPQLKSLCLESAGVAYDASGIRVDKNLRTSQRHIYAAGDCTGSYQFTHYAAYQGFMAVRNAFLPRTRRAVLGHVPWVTFTDPEVAHVGLTESQAREQNGADVEVSNWPMNQVDRAVVDGSEDGFLKVVHGQNGKLLGATVASPRAGELIQEWALALDHGLKISDLAQSLHAYPTYSLANQQLATQVTVERMLSGRMGKVIRRFARGLVG